MVLPALITASAFALGILLGNYFPSASRFCYFVLLVCFIIAWIVRRKDENKTGSFLLLISIVLIGFLRCHQYQSIPANHILRKYIPDMQFGISGFVQSEPLETKDRIQFIIKIDSLLHPQRSPSCGRILVRSEKFDPELRYGDGIRIFGRLGLPKPPTNPGGFDYRSYLARQSIYLTLQNLDSLSLKDTWKGSLLRKWIIYPLRSKIRETFRNCLPQDQNGIMQALLLGEKGGLDEEMYRRFSDLGIVHTLAVSGLHVGFILSLLQTAASFLRLKSGMKQILILLGILIYCLLTDAKPPVMRATCVAILYIIAKRSERTPSSLNLIGTAAFFILALRPMDLFDPGFQLSFISVASILCLANPILSLLSRLAPGTQRLPLTKKLMSLLAVSSAAQIGSLPLTLYYFYRIPLWALLANLFAIPLIGIMVALGFTTVLAFTLSSWLGRVFGFTLNAAIQILQWLVDRTHSLPGPSILIPFWSPWLLCAYISAILILVAYKNPKISRPLIVLTLFFINIHVWIRAIQCPTRNLIWTQLDVSQGDAAFIQLPRGKKILIDSGDCTQFFDSGRNVLVPFLESCGVTSLDAVFLTHPHNDHIGGLLYLLQRIHIRKLFTAGTPWVSPIGETIGKKIMDLKIPVLIIGAGDTLKFPGIQILILSPTEHRKSDTLLTRWNPNNQSLVARLRYGNTNLLFMGDAEMEIENELLHSSVPFQSNILKVAHHGSKTSSSLAFLKTVNPQLALISVGQNNRFKHPSPNTLARFEDLNIPLLRTDLHGAIQIMSSGKTFKCISPKNTANCKLPETHSNSRR